MVRRIRVSELRKIRAFAMSERGSVALAFGLMAMTLVLGAGAAIDLMRASNYRGQLQAAADAAALAGVAARGASRASVADTVLQSNLAGSGVSGSGAWTTNADGSFTGTVAGQVKTLFMKIARINDINVAATATAGLVNEISPTSVTFTLNYAKGFYWKKVTLWTHTPGDAGDTLRATYIYQPDDLRGEGSGSTTGPLGSAITLGTNYDSAHLEMEVSPDGCAPGYAPEHPEALAGDTNYLHPFTCVPVGQNSAVKTVTTYTLKTNDPATADHLFIDGTQLSKGATAAVSSLFKCGGSVTHMWEDMLDYVSGADGNSGAWATQDIRFIVQSDYCGANTALHNGVRLIR